MIIQMPEEIAYLKDSEKLFKKIEEIKTMLLEKNCTSGIDSIRFQDNVLRLNLSVSFPVT